ncbi:MAG: hypothetical protein ABW094_16285 [Candidatus Thiodiazotropha sp.]
MEQSHIKRKPVNNIALWVIAIFLVIEALGVSIYISQFSELFKGFGSELPVLTKAVLFGAWAIWLLPISTAALIVFNKTNEKQSIVFGIILLLVGVLWVPITIYGIYLPVWELSEAELP